MQTTILNISGINNTNTAASIKDAINSIEGVSFVSVDPNTSKIVITFDPEKADLTAIKSTISNTGFTVH